MPERFWWYAHKESNLESLDISQVQRTTSPWAHIFIHVKYHSRAGLFNVTPQLAFEFEYLQDIHLRM